MENNYIVYCNVNANGNITTGITGNNIIPDKQYEYFFIWARRGLMT